MELSKLQSCAVEDDLRLCVRGRSTSSATGRGFNHVNPRWSYHDMVDIPARTRGIVVEDMAAVEHELVEFLADGALGPQAESITTIKTDHTNAGDRAQDHQPDQKGERPKACEVGRMQGERDRHEEKQRNRIDKILVELLQVPPQRFARRAQQLFTGGPARSCRFAPPAERIPQHEDRAYAQALNA